MLRLDKRGLPCTTLRLLSSLHSPGRAFRFAELVSD